MLAWCFQWLLTNAAFLRWRAARTLRALLCAVGLGSRVDRDDVMAASDASDADDEPEVEDVEAVGLLPPARHLHDYARVRDILASWHESDDNRLGQLPAGLTNSGNTCFAASALQCLYHTRLFTAHFSDGPHDSCDARGFCVTCEYQAHVKRALDAEPKASFSIGRLTSAIGKIAKHFVRGRQEDSHEYISGLLDGMHTQWLKEAGGPDAEKTLDLRTQETTMVYHVFGGYVCGRVVCSECGHESRTYQSMIDVPVEVSARGALSVTSSLESNFVKTETLDGDNKYKCGRCRAYVAAEKGAKIHVSPNVLVVPLKRYQMGRVSKITKFVEYPLELNLSPYMSPDAPHEGEGPPEYVLYGVVVHLDWMGSAHSGHYVSYVRLLDGRWCKCDDGRVEEADEATVLKQKAYLLFYERKTVRAAPPIRTRAQQTRVDRLEEAERARRARVEARRAAARAKKSPARAAAPASPLPAGRVVPEHTVKTVGIQRGTENDGSSSSSDDDLDSPPALPTPWPQRVVCVASVPTMSSSRDFTYVATRRDVVVTARRTARARVGDVKLEVDWPYPIEDDDCEVIFDKEARTLKIIAPVLRFDPVAGAKHAEHLAARSADAEAEAEASAAKAKAKAAKLRRAGMRGARGSRAAAAARAVDRAGDGSSSEWVTDEDGEDEEEEDDGTADHLADEMGLMNVRSPTTRAAARRAAAAAADGEDADDDAGGEAEAEVKVSETETRTSVSVSVPGVSSAEEVEAEVETDARGRSTLRVRARGKYRADVALPGKLEEEAELEARFRRREGTITFTLPKA